LSESAKENAPYSFTESGQVRCNWPGCEAQFTPDPPGLKAFAAHWAAHKKKGQKPPETKGLTPEEMAALIDWKKRYDEAAKKAVIKTCDQILSDRDRIFEVYVPIFDCKVKYGRMLVHEFMSIMEKPEEQYIREALYLMWSKGDPSVTREKLEKYDFEEIRQIFFYIVENTPFLFQTRSGTASSLDLRKSKDSNKS